MNNKLVLYIIARLTWHVHANIPDLPHILQDAATTIASTTTTNQQTQQQLLQLFASLTGAIKLAFSFFKNMFAFLFTCITTVCSPFVWLTCQLWSNFVSKPFDLLMHVARVFYPVMLFCFAAICCGLFIGGCAGFAAEACSSLLISATWGPQPIKKVEEEEEESVSEERVKKDMDDETDDDYEEQEPPVLLKSTASSIWESSSSFFGVQPPQSKKAAEKEPLNAPKVELWRDSVSPPVLIRRKKLSSPRDDWEWEEDEEDIYRNNQQRPSSSSSSSMYYKNSGSSRQ